MIGDRKERENKKALQDAMDKMQRNIVGCGGKEVLINKYPAGYKKLHSEIAHKVNEYLATAVSGMMFAESVPMEEISVLWNNQRTEIAKAIEDNNSDLIQNMISDFIFNKVLPAYGMDGRIVIQYALDEGELSPQAMTA